MWRGVLGVALNSRASRDEEMGKANGLISEPQTTVVSVHGMDLFLAPQPQHRWPQSQALCLAHSGHSVNVRQYEQSPSEPHAVSTITQVSQGTQPSSWQRPGPPSHSWPGPASVPTVPQPLALPSSFHSSLSLGHDE